MTDNGKSTIPENERPGDESTDLAAEFAEVGRKLRDAFGSAWNSAERHKIEKDIREGLSRFADEVNDAATNLRDSDLAHKVESGAKQVRQDIESGKVSEDVRKGLVKALRSLSESLDKMASSFTPVEGEGKGTPKK
jgi:phosphoenolpyruvate synthase/pyruvate phosphate dikinase